MLAMTKERILFLVRYIVSGLTAIGVQTLTLFVWVNMLGLQSLYLVGTMLGFLLGLSVGFVLQKYWTFNDRSHHTVHVQMFWYILVALMNLILNTVLLAAAKHLFEALGFDFFHIWYLVAQVCILLTLAVGAFIINTLVTFRS